MEVTWFDCVHEQTFVVELDFSGITVHRGFYTSVVETCYGYIVVP